MSKSEDAALAILAECGIVEPPVDVEEIARRKGALLSFGPLDADVSGMLFRDGGTVLIGVNSAHSSTRQRFTIAHELGHWSLHKGNMIIDTLQVNFRDKTSSLATDRKEIEANAFAADLLMPERFIFEEVSRLIKSDSLRNEEQLITQLAQRFVVSRESMSYRLVNLGIVKTTPS